MAPVQGWHAICEVFHIFKKRKRKTTPLLKIKNWSDRDKFKTEKILWLEQEQCVRCILLSYGLYTNILINSSELKHLKNSNTTISFSNLPK